MRDIARPRFCLVVQDRSTIALDLADALEDRGFFVAGPMTTSKEALRWLGRFTPDIAVIDPILKDGLCTGLASELDQRGVPFVIYSACSLSSGLLPLVKGTWVEQTCLLTDLAALVTRLLL
jgi:DNA-binding NtrC family response regulator